MKNKILLFSYHQFGSLTDTVNYCKYTKDYFDITYMGWDYNRPKIDMPGVKIKYVSRDGSLLYRNYNLLKLLHLEIRSGNYDLVFVHYTRGCSLVRLFNRNTPFVLDIRTLSINPIFYKRKLFNLCLKLESLFFESKSVITNGIAKQLKIKSHYLLPLGADYAHEGNKFKSKDIHLLYVGTLHYRHILKCVKGFHIYLNETCDLNSKMTIVGDSFGNELTEIKDYIKMNKISHKVICTGRLPFTQLEQYFREATIGVSFVPLTKWYDHQPPTKTYEYLMANLPVIATATFENSDLLKNEEMSVLIKDTENDFAKAVEKMKEILSVENNYNIKDKYYKHQWREIVLNYFIPIVEDNLQMLKYEK